MALYASFPLMNSMSVKTCPYLSFLVGRGLLKNTIKYLMKTITGITVKVPIINKTSFTMSAWFTWLVTYKISGKITYSITTNSFTLNSIRCNCIILQLIVTCGQDQITALILKIAMNNTMTMTSPHTTKIIVDESHKTQYRS